MTTVERRPSRAGVVAAVALVVGGVLLVLGGGGGGGGGDDDDDAGPAPTPPPTETPTTRPTGILPGETADLVLAADGDLVRLNLASGVVTDLPLGDRDGGIAQRPLVTSDVVVVVQRFVAWSIDPLGRRPPIELGPADAVVPADPGFVWLADLRGDVARRVGVGGNAGVLEVPLPLGTWRVSPVAGRFVLTTQTRWLLLEADGRIALERAGRVIASRDDQVAWLPTPCRAGPCEVRITDVASGQERSFALEAATSVSIHDAAMSDDLFVTGDLDGDRATYEIVRVDLASTDLATQLVAFGLEFPPMGMGEGDGTLFWTTRDADGVGSLLTAHDLDTGETRSIELPFREVSTFSAF